MLAQECVTKSIYNREESRTKRLRRIPFKKNQSENSRDQLNSGTKRNRGIDESVWFSTMCFVITITSNELRDGVKIIYCKAKKKLVAPETPGRGGWNFLTYKESQE